MANKLLFFILIYTSIAFSINLSGKIEKNRTLKTTDNPIVITGNIEIPEDITLTIEPGVKLKFNGYYRLIVKGILLATGTKTMPIEFTSNKEVRKTDDWEGIVFYGNKSGGYLKYCKIKYAFKNLIWKSSPTIQNCQFTYNNYAIYCSFSKNTKILENNISNNNFGVYCDFSAPIIQKNNIMSNTYGIYCVLSSAPIVGENTIVSNRENNIFMDDSMGKNKAENVNNHVWDLMKGLF